MVYPHPYRLVSQGLCASSPPVMVSKHSMNLPRLTTWLLVCFFSLLQSAHAHEFWLLPSRFTPDVKQDLTLHLAVGEQFEGETVAFGTAVVADLNLYTRAGSQSLQALVPSGAQNGELPVAFAQKGGHLLAMDSVPFTVELSADTFTAYLREEGLESIIALRQVQGQAKNSGRERYRRHVKTFLHIGGTKDASFGVRTGQTLEIVPLQDPTVARAQGTTFAVLFEGKPLQNALIKAWHKDSPKTSAQLTVLHARTNAQGQATFKLPWPGTWMLSVVHMVPAANAEGIDWDSYWGNYTFLRAIR